MSTAPLRTAILDAALPLIARQSFTRAVVHDGARVAMRARRRAGDGEVERSDLGPAQAGSTPQQGSAAGGDVGLPLSGTELPAHEVDSILSTLFGSGTGPEAALVAHWADRGVEDMRAAPGRGIAETLSRRLEWSERTAGEHIVEAHALLSAPSDPLAIPLPRSLRYILSTLRMPAPYRPPQLLSPSSSEASTDHLSSANLAEGSDSVRAAIKLPVLNPLPVLGYAMRIADEAVHLADQAGEGVPVPADGAGGTGALSTAETGQEGAESRAAPGGGTDWYLRRLALGLIYLKAESRLLLPRTASSPLPSALSTLHTSLSHYISLASSLRAALPPISNTGDEPALAPRGADGRREGDAWREAGEFGAFVWKSWGGLFRSRGWIR